MTPKETGASRVVLRTAPVARTGLDVLQVVVTVLIAAAAAAGGLLTSQAGGGRQQAVREEIKRTAATVEDVRLLYGDEAPVAFRIAVGRIRAEELHRAGRAAGSAGAAAEVEAVVQEQTAFAFATGEEGTGRLADGDRYRSPEGGFDVGRRLAEIRAGQPELTGLDPDATQASADRRGRAARTVTGSVAVLVLAYLVVALGWSTWWRRSDLPGTDTDPGLVPQPWSTDGFRRGATTVALLAWVLLTVLTGPQVKASDQEQQAQSLAARKAALISTSIAASTLREGFIADSRRAELSVDIGVNARELGALDAPAALATAERVTAAADRAAMPRIRAVLVAMTALPDIADGVDPATRAALASTRAEWTTLLIEQNEQARSADRASQRSDRLVIALLLGGLAASLIAIAAARPRAAAPLLYAPVAFLIGSVTVAIAALLS